MKGDFEFVRATSDLCVFTFADIEIFFSVPAGKASEGNVIKAAADFVKRECTDPKTCTFRYKSEFDDVLIKLQPSEIFDKENASSLARFKVAKQTALAKLGECEELIEAGGTVRVSQVSMKSCTFAKDGVVFDLDKIDEEAFDKALKGAKKI